jgi:predicted  nucleic acid-binding Zn-ribbon protein
MFAEDEKIIRTYLVGDFEEKFFDACLANLREEENVLRVNNFAYAMRELIRNVLDRLAPKEEVMRAPWYVQNEDVKDGPTRMQRIKYAIQGWLTDASLHEQLHMDVTEVLKNLKNSINELSKYTHVEPETFDVDEKICVELSESVLKHVVNLFETIKEEKQAVHKAVLECVDEDMIEQFYQTTNPEIDILSTHHEIEGYCVNEIDKEDDEKGNVHVSISGSVDVRLQYGSNGDMRRGIGWDTHESFPFTSELDVSYKNQFGDVRILEDGEYSFDVNSFYH